MKILQITSGKCINGALTYCQFLSENLIANGHSVTILCRRDGWIEQQAIKGAKFHFSEMQRTPNELLRIARWIKLQKFDVINTHMSRAHSFGVLLKLLTGVPVVATAHSRSIQLHWKLNDYVIANSQATERYHRRRNFVSKKRMETIHCFSNLQRFQEVCEADKKVAAQEMRLAGNEFTIGLVGEITPRKGHLYLFQALKRIAEKIPNFKLILLGRYGKDQKYYQQLQQLLKRDGLSEHVQWMGMRLNVEDYLSLCDISVVPSLEEPLGLVAIESLAAGTPVIAANTGGLPEIVEDGVNGLLVPTKDSDSIANAVIHMHANPAMRASMGQQGRASVFQKFDPQVLTEQVEGVYCRLANIAHEIKTPQEKLESSTLKPSQAKAA